MEWSPHAEGGFTKVEDLLAERDQVAEQLCLMELALLWSLRHWRRGNASKVKNAAPNHPRGRNSLSKGSHRGFRPPEERNGVVFDRITGIAVMFRS